MIPNHISILKAFDQFKFNLGKKTLIEFLKGNINSTIERNNLDELNSYGSLYQITIEEIEEIINQLIEENYLITENIKGGFKVIKRTNSGIKEIIFKKFKFQINKKIKTIKINEIFSKETIISNEDKKHFKIFDFFLKGYNNEQKKAIISRNKHLLIIAGAGSGKTTVLTKRIEFLSKFKGIKQKNILAITFTKKAREEMSKRLQELEINNVKIETFNSFCEKELKIKGKLIYNQHMKVIQYKDKISIVKTALNNLNINIENLGINYFNKKQLREKSKDELIFIFTNDIYSIIDFFKNKEKNINNFYEKEKNLLKKNIAKQIKEICVFVETEMKRRGIRDFSDQILDTLKLFRKYKNEIPIFEHILIDEFQDINYPQFELIKILKSSNIFVVGDPRQAIYGWRGSNINFILNYPKEYSNSEIINLKENYRSKKQIVDIFNKVIKPLGFIDLNAAKIENKLNIKTNNNDQQQQQQQNVFLLEQKNENQERIFILQAIKNSKNPRNEIFILARTNKLLENLAEYLNKNNIPYAIKFEEGYKKSNAKENEITLATIHSIKGMEAKEVYLISANSTSFPNKVSENFVFNLAKENTSKEEKENEELRLFYVALSRAKEKLIITYTGNFSKFITKEIISKLNIREKSKSNLELKNSKIKSNLNLSKKLNNTSNTVLKSFLKNWRNKIAQKNEIPTYMILNNNTIEELSIRKPKTKDELYYINGLGSKKIEQYSKEILEIINSQI